MGVSCISNSLWSPTFPGRDFLWLRRREGAVFSWEPIRLSHLVSPQGLHWNCYTWAVINRARLTTLIIPELLSLSSLLPLASLLQGAGLFDLERNHTSSCLKVFVLSYLTLYWKALPCNGAGLTVSLLIVAHALSSWWDFSGHCLSKTAPNQHASSSSGSNLPLHSNYHWTDYILCICLLPVFFLNNEIEVFASDWSGAWHIMDAE